MKLEEALGRIRPASKETMDAAKERWDNIAMPLHSLGRLQDTIVRIAGMTGNVEVSLKKKALLVMCADNGVVEEGVTQTGQEVTLLVAENMVKQEAVSSLFCRRAGADLFPVDVGIAAESHAINRKIAWGTKNMTKGPAMTRQEAEKAIEVGISMVEELKEKGYTIIATGEMGIGNTTTSSAVASVLLHKPVEEMTGRGAGLSGEGLKKKIAVIKQAIDMHKPDPEDAIDVLAKVGGFDIAGMAGVCLGAAALHTPVVIDGFISGVAALVAVRICPETAEYMIASHVSSEPAAQMILDALGKKAFLHAEMHWGEGTGAVTLFPLLDMAASVYNSMSTFQDIQIEEYKHFEE